MDWIGWDLCAGLFYEHRFAMLINLTTSDKFTLKNTVSMQRDCRTVTVQEKQHLLAPTGALYVIMVYDIDI